MDTRSHGGIQPIPRDSVTATATTQPFVSDIHPFQEQARRRLLSWWRPLHQQPRTYTHHHRVLLPPSMQATP